MYICDQGWDNGAFVHITPILSFSHKAEKLSVCLSICTKQPLLKMKDVYLRITKLYITSLHSTTQVCKRQNCKAPIIVKHLLVWISFYISVSYTYVVLTLHFEQINQESASIKMILAQNESCIIWDHQVYLHTSLHKCLFIDVSVQVAQM